MIAAPIRTYFGGLERGQRNVALVNIEKLVKTLRISLSELFRGVFIAVCNGPAENGAPLHDKNEDFVHQDVVQFADNTSACSRTVIVAFSCLSGGYPYLRRIRFTRTLK